MLLSEFNIKFLNFEEEFSVHSFVTICNTQLNGSDGFHLEYQVPLLLDFDSISLSLKDGFESRTGERTRTRANTFLLASRGGFAFIYYNNVFIQQQLHTYMLGFLEAKDLGRIACVNQYLNRYLFTSLLQLNLYS